MNQKLLKSHTILAICILILSVIPVVAIGPYLHQFADDYVFGAPVYKAWTATHSFGACIQAAWAESMHIYQTWQGTYSACFLMALQPGIFGKYWLVPIILLGSLILSTYTLGYTILRRLLHISKLEYTFISTLFVLMTVQFVWSFYDFFVPCLPTHRIPSYKIHHSENHHHAGFRSTRHIHCRRQLCYRSGYASHSLYGNRMDVGGEEEDSFLLAFYPYHLCLRFCFQCICTRQYCPPIHSHQSTECGFSLLYCDSKGHRISR